MILKALYDYYNRCDELPSFGMEEKEIGFLIVLSQEGDFRHIEDCRIDKDHARTYLVKKHVGRSSAVAANYLYDNSSYVLGYSDKDNGKEQLCFDAFKEKVNSIYSEFPNNADIKAVKQFYDKSRDEIIALVSKDSNWENIKKSLSKKYSIFSFRIEGDLKIVAEKKELLQLNKVENKNPAQSFCLVSGKYGLPVETTTATMIAGSQATAKLVSFQVNSGYDSYGKTKCYNAPISEEAEFAYTTALNTLLQKDSHNKFVLGSRTFVFWASSNSDASIKTEESLFDLLGSKEEKKDDPNANIAKVRKVFEAIYSGKLKTTLEDKFYILGLAPNSARIAVVYWSETILRDFAAKLISHFDDMEIVDTRKEKKPYQGMRNMISTVTLNGKDSDATPNLPESVLKSIFQGLLYPFTLYSACIRRIRAEQQLTIARAAIVKAYLNRLKNDNNEKIKVMLDKENTNQGYLCGRLFAVLDKIQEEANKISSIRERYMNAASATPSSVFATILNLSLHHSEKLSDGRRIYFEKIKQEIIDKLSADGFPTHLDLQNQGRFFVGYYHQRQDFFTGKNEQE